MSNQTMMLTKAQQRTQGGGSFNTFQMIPVSNDCPYINCIYDVTSSQFILFLKEKKTYVQTVPKMDEFGGNAMKNGKPLAERRTVEDYFEVSITDPEDIQAFIQQLAINHDNVSLYLPYISEVKVTTPGMEKPSAIIMP